MDQKIAELKKDISELEALLNQANRQKVKDILSIELRKLVSEHVKLEETYKNAATPSSTPVVPTNRRYQIKLNNYAWDQSAKYVKFFVTVEGVHNIPPENVTCRFTAKSLELDIKDLNNKDYLFTINKLLYPINPESSTWKVKTDMVVISASKVESTNWSHVTEIEKKVSDAKAKKYDTEKTDNPNDSLMNMMRKMYDEGDDELKRTIAKAWTEGQNKKNVLDV